MYRLLVLLLVIIQLVPIQPTSLSANANLDSENAARVTVELSELEATGNINALYDRIHPDARAEIPRAAVIGWFENEFVPLGPGVSTVIDVRFVSWTWQVTGQTYPYTAEVSFTQPFRNGSVVEDVVRLVEDRNGEWRWFFGRSREFVDDQIAKYAPVLPIATDQTSLFQAVIQDIDAYWEISFRAAGVPYHSPWVVDIFAGADSLCGYIEPNAGPGFYCPLDQTVYISIYWLTEFDRRIGDFAWITVIAHEWSHHVQRANGIDPGRGNLYELQADCLAGSYALDAETRGLLQPGDITEAITIAAISGDVVGLPQDRPGAHGTSDDRVTAFMRGYLDGFTGCGLDLTDSGSVQVNQEQPVGSPELSTLFPGLNELPADLEYTGGQSRALDTVAANYTNPQETERLFRRWGWEGNVTGSYDGDGSISGVTSVYVSIHRFGSPANAARAMDYSVTDQMTSTGAWEVLVDPVGEYTRALSTNSDLTLYMQHGEVIVRLTIWSRGVDPMPIAVEIMNAIARRMN